MEKITVEPKRKNEHGLWYLKLDVKLPRPVEVVVSLPKVIR